MIKYIEYQLQYLVPAVQGNNVDLERRAVQRPECERETNFGSGRSSSIQS